MTCHALMIVHQHQSPDDVIWWTAEDVMLCEPCSLYLQASLHHRGAYYYYAYN